MRRIGDWNLWIGARGDLRDLLAVRRLGVGAIVDLAIDEEPISPGREMIYCRVPLMDGSGSQSGFVGVAVGVVVSLVRSRVGTLVACSGGMSRSPAVAAGAAALLSGREVGEVLAEIAQGGPTDVSGGIWRAVCEGVEVERVRERVKRDLR